MTTNDAGMNLTAGAVIGLVVAGLLGLMFVVSCVASVVKAVRDRKQIKARIAAKRAQQLNGHAPGASSLEDEGRMMRGRPNILIIHDGEREERVKKGTTLPPSTSSPRFPSRFSSSPEDRTPSRRTESTTVAEVACHYGSSSRTTSPGDEGPGSEGGASAAEDSPCGRGRDRCYLPGQVSEAEDNDVDISGDVVMYRSGFDDGDDSSVPVCSFSEDGDISRLGGSLGDSKGRIQGGSGGGAGRPRGKTLTRKSRSQSSLKYVADDNVFEEDRQRERSRDKNSPLGKGFAKNRKVSSSHALARGAENAQAAYNPRRNSYASAIATGPDWLDQPAARRHSDETRPATSSASRSRKDNVRMRNQCRDGADNPAYNDADDRIAI